MCGAMGPKCFAKSRLLNAPLFMARETTSCAMRSRHTLRAEPNDSASVAKAPASETPLVNATTDIDDIDAIFDSVVLHNGMFTGFFTTVCFQYRVFAEIVYTRCRKSLLCHRIMAAKIFPFNFATTLFDIYGVAIFFSIGKGTQAIISITYFLLFQETRMKNSRTRKCGWKVYKYL